MMKRFCSTLLLLLLIQTGLFAETKTSDRGQGFVFAGLGQPARSAPSPLFQFGAGGEGMLLPTLGIGGEISYLGPVTVLRQGIGVMSLNGSYHFTPKEKIDPFVTTGYSLFFRSGTANGFNIGGGFNYWLRDNLGLRVEFRDQVMIARDTYHTLGMRLGLVFH